MAKKRKDINYSVNQEMDRIKSNLTLDMYCKHWGDNKNEIWKKYTNLTMDKYLQLSKQEQQRIKTYMKDYYCPIEYLEEIEGKVHTIEGITWNDILSWKKDKIHLFQEYQSRLMEKCRKSPKCLIIDEGLPF